jgi:hypothetical protein
MRRCLKNGNSMQQEEIEVSERSVGRGKHWTLRFTLRWTRSRMTGTSRDGKGVVGCSVARYDA